MANNLVKFGLLFTAIDQATAPMRKITSAFGEVEKSVVSLTEKVAALKKNMEAIGKAGEKMKDIGKPLAAMGAVGTLGIQQTVQSFANLEEAQRRLRTTLMDSTGTVGSEYEKLNALAEKLGTDLPGSTKDMLEMFIALREQGVQTNVILGGAGAAAAKFASLMKLPFAEAATHVAKFSESMGVSDKDMEKFMDTLQRLKYASGVEVGDLAYTFKYAGGSLKMLGLQGLEGAKQFSAVVGVLAAAGIEGSTAGTNMAQALSRMAEIGHRLDRGQVKKLVGPILDKYSIDLQFFDASGKFKGLREMTAELEKLKALNPQEQIITLKKLFGDEAARPLAVLLKGGVAAYDEMLRRMQAQADMETKIKEIMSGVKMQWETMTGTAANLAAHIGGTFAKLMDLPSILGKLNDLFGRLDSWVLLHPKTAGVLGGIVLGITGVSLAAGTLLLTVGALASLLPKLVTGFELLAGARRVVMGTTAAIRLMEIASSGNIWAALKWNITGAVASMRTWVTVQWAALRASIPTIASLRQMATTFVTAVVGGIRSGIRSAVLWIATQWTALRANYLNIASLKSMGSAFIGTVTTAIKTAALALWQWVTAQTAAFRANFLTLSGLKGMAAAFGSNLLSGIRAVTLAVRGFSVALLGTPIGWISLAVAGVAFLIFRYWKPITAFFKGVWAGIKEGVKGLEPAWNLFKKYALVIAPFFAPLKVLYNLIKSLLKPVDDTGKAAESMGLRFGRAIGRILTGVLTLPGKMLQAGMNIITSLTDGMLRMINKPGEVMKKLADKIRRFLPFSPAKEGPLKDIHRVRLVETIAEGVRPQPLVNAVKGATAAAMIAATPVMAASPNWTPQQAAMMQRRAAQVTAQTQRIKQVVEPVKLPTLTVQQQKIKRFYETGTSVLPAVAQQVRAIPAAAQVTAQTRTLPVTELARPASGSSGRGQAQGGSVVVNYKPTITFTGEASPATEKKFAELLRQHSRDIERIVTDINKQQQRRTF